MDAIFDLFMSPFRTAVASGGLVVVLLAVGLFLLFFKSYVSDQRGGKPPTRLPRVPEVPGIPILGNLLQLKEKKPFKSFMKWAETYGPIYSIRTGANTLVVLSSTDLAKEAMVTRFSSISTRKLPNALKFLTSDKTMVAMSDYNDFHKTVKRHAINNLLGPNAQKKHRGHRDTLMENTSNQLYALAKTSPKEAVHIRKILQSELFGLAMRQTMGTDVESIYVNDLGTTMTRDEIFDVLVNDPMMGSLEVDWRDFFPYLKWVPNSSLERKVRQICIQREAVMNALMHKQKNRIASGVNLDSYIDYLLVEAQTFTEKQLMMLLWEPIIQMSDTTMVTIEWAIYELAKNPKLQARLYAEILSVCGTSEKITEEKLGELPYLSAIFHETLRRHSPVPLIPLRYVHENTVLGGYHVPAGTELAINIYGCNMDKNTWENPEEWNPDRFLKENESIDLQKTMAFGAGKRVCSGALQAMLISCVCIGRMVQDFEWRLKDDDNFEEGYNMLLLTSQKVHPMLALIEPRN